MKELKDTINLMQSDDFKERFKAEYYQTEIRYNKLSEIIGKYYDNALKFTPKTPIRILEAQLNAMGVYLDMLQRRAEYENITL